MIPKGKPLIPVLKLNLKLEAREDKDQNPLTVHVKMTCSSQAFLMQCVILFWNDRQASSDMLIMHIFTFKFASDAVTSCCFCLLTTKHEFLNFFILVSNID